MVASQQTEGDPKERQGFLGGSGGKNQPACAPDLGLIPGPGRPHTPAWKGSLNPQLRSPRSQPEEPLPRAALARSGERRPTRSAREEPVRQGRPSRAKDKNKTKKTGGLKAHMWSNQVLCKMARKGGGPRVESGMLTTAWRWVRGRGRGLGGRPGPLCRAAPGSVRPATSLSTASEGPCERELVSVEQVILVAAVHRLEACS